MKQRKASTSHTVLAAFLALATIGLAVHAGEATATYQGWQHSGSIYLLTTPEGANLPTTASEDNFPVLVRLDKDWFDFKQAKANGEDIRFATATGTLLAYQIDDWDAVTGTASIWVRIPTIKGNARQELKLYWGKADLEGYAQVAQLMSPLVEQDNYGLVSPQTITAPNLKRASFASADRFELVLEFGQPMAWKDEMKRYFCLDGMAAPIGGGAASGNNITLVLTAPSQTKTISYLSGKDWDGTPKQLLYGANGIAALAFSAVPIEAPAK